MGKTKVKVSVSMTVEYESEVELDDKEMEELKKMSDEDVADNYIDKMTDAVSDDVDNVEVTYFDEKTKHWEDLEREEED